MKYKLLYIFFVSFALGFEVLEFSQYQKESIKPTLYLVSEKYDGVRGVWDGKTLRTKRGNIIAAPACWIEKLPPFALDGELWMGYKGFESVQALSTRKDSVCDDWQKVRYKVFDAPTCALESSYKNGFGDQSGFCTLFARLDKVREFLQTKQESVIDLIPQSALDFSDNKSFDTLDFLLQEVLKKGGEGLILRIDDKAYTPGRAKDELKLKAYADSECKVIGYTEGKGRLEGKTGALICEQEIQEGSDFSYDFSLCAKPCVIHFKIGSGLSDELRENPPEIGSVITYRYNGFSKNGLPKFARFLRMYAQ
ncbi:DNA ligase [Helicobacter sp. 10-6591]|uniref:DNA ligase n=1 Tax=Helicobacter sp. 10-6591 TaxID=2004998 RepID=UPI0015EB4F19|nr:DNA ligase [Helicobacter sp. 10-6591]